MPRTLVLLMVGDEYGPRVLENICAQGFSSWIHGVHEFSEVPPLEAVLDEPEAYVPDGLPECELLLSLGLPQELQALLPAIAERTRAEAVIAAICNSSWLPPGLRRQLEDDLASLGVAYAFPKPGCSLQEVGHPAIDEFARFFGRPRLALEVRGGIIRRVEVLRGAPCGSTWFVAEKMVGQPVEPKERLWEEAAKAHHVYPCMGSMNVDSELGDTVLHAAQYLLREAVEEALKGGGGR